MGIVHQQSPFGFENGAYSAILMAKMMKNHQMLGYFIDKPISHNVFHSSLISTCHRFSWRILMLVSIEPLAFSWNTWVDLNLGDLVTSP